MVEVTQADRTVADLMLIARHDYYRRCEIAARHREAALTTAQAEAEALRAEIERLRGALREIAGFSEVNGMTRLRMRRIARAALSEPMP